MFKCYMILILSFISFGASEKKPIKEESLHQMANKKILSLLETKKIEKKDNQDQEKISSDQPEDGGQKWDSSVKEDEGKDISVDISIEDIIEPPSEYHYSAFGKEDPFRAPLMVKEAVVDQEKPASYEIPIISPLQDKLENLSIKGIWQLDNGVRKALIETKDGQGIISSIGDAIGPSGKIIEINENGVVTRQYKINEDGSRKYEDKMIMFAKKEDPKLFIKQDNTSPTNEKYKYNINNSNYSNVNNQTNTYKR